jgi:integrase
MTSCPNQDSWTPPVVCDPPATPGHWAGCAPPNKGQRYPADPPTVEEIILVMRQAGPGPYADRTRGLIAILWRAGLRVSEALALTETDLDPKTGSVLVRQGKGGKRSEPSWGAWRLLALENQGRSSCLQIAQLGSRRRVGIRLRRSRPR